MLERLAADATWNLVAPAADVSFEEAASAEESTLWWAPRYWPQRNVETARDTSAIITSGDKLKRDCYGLLWGAPGVDSAAAESLLTHGSASSEPPLTDILAVGGSQLSPRAPIGEQPQNVGAGDETPWCRVENRPSHFHGDSSQTAQEGSSGKLLLCNDSVENSGVAMSSGVAVAVGSRDLEPVVKVERALSVEPLDKDISTPDSDGAGRVASGRKADPRSETLGSGYTSERLPRIEVV